MHDILSGEEGGGKGRGFGRAGEKTNGGKLYVCDECYAVLMSTQGIAEIDLLFKERKRLMLDFLTFQQQNGILLERRRMPIASEGRFKTAS